MHLFQVGAGSGGMVVLDLVMRDPRITKITLIEPDTYEEHNIHRHFFPQDDVGARKANLAARWIEKRRPDIKIALIMDSLMSKIFRKPIEQAANECDIGVCAVDNEPAKYHFDSLMRKFAKPWTLGEVLSGGIGGWIHRFTPNGACYGCVASHLQREIKTDNTPPPDYANPGAQVQETTIPATKASIDAIASLHALMTLGMLDAPVADGDFSSLLLTLKRVEGVFDEPFRTYRFRIARNPECLICKPVSDAPSSEDLDVALDQALARLGDQ